jgi:hypothetical protein
MKSLVIGPFFSPTQCEVTEWRSINPLSIQLEWAGADVAGRVPLFRYRSEDALGRLTPEKVVWKLHPLPFRLQCARCDVIETQTEIFLPLEALLVGLYSGYKVGRSVFQLLAEFAALLPLEYPGRPLAANPGLLIPDAEERGFALSTVIHDGEEVYAEIGWRPPQQDYVFHTCICAFSRDDLGTPDAGRWQPAGKIGFGQLLSQELRRLVPGAPGNLLAEAGIEHLQNHVRTESQLGLSR